MSSDVGSKQGPIEELSPSGTNRELAARCFLSEYSSLRQSIGTLTTIQNAVLGANIALLGGLIGSALVSEPSAILLVLPIVSSLLGIYWAVLHVAISKNGHYIRKTIAIKLQDLCGDKEVMTFETQIRDDLDTKIKAVAGDRFPEFAQSLLLPLAGGASVFILSCILGIVLAGLIDLNNWEQGLWVLGIILTLLLLAFCYRAGEYWLDKSSDQASSRR